ncbi:MAG TPA: 50S ribosomal protein L7/L12 [Candidatus Hydrothermia bacterium]|nr:50S ribosomal protein L7/L12 [Candidatus Hydrothermae bacterium]MDD3648916.1 50S ribosomal protein L7/L12 [Candidatus Hydrothermia bacterium]MDD5572600.1 50S ribosomal protein L7/L12 [Candidatus Hydrothermia bacterium]HOK23157.1 50S ribosomal protein L7/L12 [Candidatus Hydrothermia bacterium]HOL23861.1 50S ribosomal protein L7/L12 [Candidatus Hydrothermia bacterium]
MAEKKSVDEIVEMIGSLSVLELSELVKELEDKFGVSAQMPVMAGAVAAQGSAPAAVEEKTEFDVILLDAGQDRINVLKEVRTLTGLGLKEAKDFVDNLPKPLKEGVTKEEAEKIRQSFEKLGAKVEVK